jgi:hypothetical protein
MSEKVLDSKNGQGKTFDLSEYSYSLSICKDFPRIIRMYTSLLEVLYHFQHYHGVAVVVNALEDAKILMNLQLKFYSNVKAKKGLVDEKK